MSASIAPSGVERRFGPDEVIVSKTDLKGRITYANPVFCRVSALTEPEVLGQPHNVIRHPDMPRGVFRLLWQTLAEGREIFAYILNLAGDGAHYWVLAHVTPSFAADGSVVGYHSNRRLPAPAAVGAIWPLYQEMLRAEAGHANAGDAAQAGLEALDRLLAERGTSYDELVWSLTTGAVA
ncbi:MAG TPA: PAS domain-containing protein [Nocardioides sp.]|uniref:PAS domain-containing protein n=1 Tax=Nocardioides sp. TaxID=35761 RepID=UPI002ED84120